MEIIFENEKEFHLGNPAQISFDFLIFNWKSWQSWIFLIILQ
jgi:hypothetical protein